MIIIIIIVIFFLHIHDEHNMIFKRFLPQTKHARDCRKKGSSLYISVKVWGLRGSHWNTARLADRYRAVALTGFISVHRSLWETEPRGGINPATH